MLVRTATRTVAPGILASIGLTAVLVVYATSQITAMTPGRFILQAAAAMPEWQRASIRVGLTIVAAIAARDALSEARDKVLPWLCTLPISEVRLAITLLPAGLIATLPIAGLAFVLGPVSGISTCIAAGLTGWLLAAGRPASALLAAGTSATGVGAPLLLGGCAHRIGRELRRRTSMGRSWPSRSMRGGPILTLVYRDVLGVTRSDGRSWLLTSAAATGLAAFVQHALQRNWSPGQTTTGAVILVGFLGWAPSEFLGRCAATTGPHLLDRTLPVSRISRVLGLWLTGALSLLGPVAAILCVGTGTSWVGGTRVVIAAMFFISSATWQVTRPSDPSGIVGHGIALAVFVTLAHAATGWVAVLPMSIMSMLLLRWATRRVR